MPIRQAFSVHRSPEVVFDYLTNPATLADWQTSKTSVEQLTPGRRGCARAVMKLLSARQFAGCHRNLRRNVEAA